MKTKIISAGADGRGFWAELNNGNAVKKNTNCNPAAFDQLVSALSAETGQTLRGVKRSLKPWIS